MLIKCFIPLQFNVDGKIADGEIIHDKWFIFYVNFTPNYFIYYAIHLESLFKIMKLSSIMGSATSDSDGSKLECGDVK